MNNNCHYHDYSMKLKKKKKKKKKKLLNNQTFFHKIIKHCLNNK